MIWCSLLVTTETIQWALSIEVTIDFLLNHSFSALSSALVHNHHIFRWMHFHNCLENHISLFAFILLTTKSSNDAIYTVNKVLTITRPSDACLRLFGGSSGVEYSFNPNHSQLSGNHPLHVFDCLMDHPVSSLLRLRTIPSTLQLDQLSSLSRDHFVVMFLSHQTVWSLARPVCVVSSPLNYSV